MKQSAGILLYKWHDGEMQFFLVHPGGPFFKNKDAGWWTIPKGEPTEGESLFDTAIREFTEETGYLPNGAFVALEPVVQKGGKKVHCWAVEGDLDPLKITCNTFTMNWPPGSGKTITCAEIDQAEWFGFDKAKEKVNGRQLALFEQLLAQTTPK